MSFNFFAHNIDSHGDTPTPTHYTCALCIKCLHSVHIQSDEQGGAAGLSKSIIQLYASHIVQVPIREVADAIFYAFGMTQQGPFGN